MASQFTTNVKTTSSVDINLEEEEATQDPAPIQKSTVSEEDCLMPTIDVLQSKQIQSQAHARTRDLQNLQDKGKFKSQRAVMKQCG